MKPTKGVLLIFLLVLSVGCEQNRFRKELREFMDRRIFIPGDMLKVYKGGVVTDVIGNELPLMVFYNSASSCTSCALTYLKERSDSLLALERAGKCRVAVIFSPYPEFVEEILNSAREMDCDFPIYFDCNDNFEELNAQFPEDLRFHCFLLGLDGHPVFVGNPLLTNELHTVFDAALDNLSLIQ